MIPGYTSYHVEIKNLRYRTGDGAIYPKTAILHFEVKGRTRKIVEIMGYVDEEEIYRWIDEGKPVVLDRCFITRMSLDNYRMNRQMRKRDLVKLKGFSARHAFFDCATPFDFAHAVIGDGDFDITGSWFNRGMVNFEGTRFTGGQVVFHDVRFADDYFDFQNVVIDNGETSFKNAIFGSGQKDFQYAQFGGSVNFSNAEFGDGDASFINAEFKKGEVAFKLTRFGEGKVDFHFAKFTGGNVSFERTEFGNGRVDFRTVEFGHGKVNFNRAQFGSGEVNFEGSEMESGKFSFKRAAFGEGSLSFEEANFADIDVSFERTRFGKGEITFYKSMFNTLSFRFCHLDDYVDLRLHECRRIDLSDTIIRDIIDLNPYEFELEVEEIRLAGTRLIGRIFIDWKRNNVRDLIANQPDTDQRLKAEQYRVLKENFSSCGQYEDEDRSYVEFKRHEERADLKDAVSRNRWNALWSYPLFWFKKALFDRAGLYATSPVRVLLTMLTVFVIFSLVYVVLILTSRADIIASVDDSLTIVARSFYHSAITFLTIGYGDHFPYLSIRWVSSLEGFAGLFLMSYFTVAFVRKVLR